MAKPDKPFMGTERSHTQSEMERIFQLSLNLICIAGTDGYFKKVNPAFNNILGYTEEEMLTTPIIEFIHPDDRKETMREVEEQLKGSVTLNFENRYRHKNGSYVWLAWNAYAVPDEGLLYANARDITKDKIAAAAIKESEERFHQLSKLNFEGIAIVENGKILFANDAVGRLFGYRPNEIIGKSPLDLTALEDHLKVHEKLATNDETPHEIIGIRKDGTRFIIEVRGRKFFHNGIERRVVSLRDITDRKKIEETLKSKSDYLQLLQDITTACNESPTTAGAMQVFLDKICDYTGWPVGHVYVPNGSGKMVSSGIWHLEDEIPFIMLEKITEETTFAYGAGMVGTVWETKKPSWITDVNTAHNFQRTQRAKETNVDLGISSTFAFPVLEGEEVVAVLEFFSAQPVSPVDAFLNLVTYLARELGRITSKKRTEEQLARHTRRIEKALYRAEDVLNTLANKWELIPHFALSSPYLKRLTIGGGDNIRCVGFRSRYAGILLHDVSGHDIEEVLLNILASSLVDIYKTSSSKKSASIPSVFLQKMNEQLVRFCSGTADYVTAIYLLLDFEKREIMISSAGHPRPLLIGADGSLAMLDIPTGFILGQFDISLHGKDRYHDLTVKLAPGELLLLYTDGLMDQRDGNGVRFEKKFMEGIGSRMKGLDPQAAHDLLAKEFESHLGSTIPNDDVSFIFVGTRSESQYETARFLPGPDLLSLLSQRGQPEGAPPGDRKPAVTETPANGPAAEYDHVVDNILESYRSILDKLRDADWPSKKISMIELALHELVINAIMHGNLCSGQSVVEVSHILHADVLEVCIADEGTGFHGKTLPQIIDESPLKENGRGHHIIGSISKNLYFNEAGNRCWALFTRED